MSDLEAAVAAEIDECDYEEVEVSPMTQWGAPDIVTICAIHGCDWDDDEAIPCWERRRMTAALRRMWDAAINAADALDKQVIDALIADLREMDAHQAISLDTWRAAADFIERFADDEPTDQQLPAEDMMRMHEGDTR